MMINKLGKDNTSKALLSRGFDSSLIKKLLDKGYTLSKLQNLDNESLSLLGLDEVQIQTIFNKGRPPIPLDVLMQVLHKSKWCCCVCREPSRGIVIHHLEEWHISHNHREDNLVVLCPLHHDEAHTKRNLTLSLDKNKLTGLKKLWLEEVKNNDRQIIIKIASDPDANWDYFNHNRLFDLLEKYNILHHDFSYASQLKESGLIDEFGRFEITEDQDRTQFYKFQCCYRLRIYMNDLLQSLLTKIPFIDITDKFKKTEIKSLVSIGNYIAIQAAFYFKQISKSHKGIDQLRSGYYKKGGIVIKFVINPYECTSDSSNFVHISGHKVATVIGQVKSMIEDNGIFVITISCLAIGCYLGKHDYWIEKQLGNYALLDDTDDYYDIWEDESIFSTVDSDQQNKN